MIRRGKAAGWLQLPSEALLPWAKLNDVDFAQSVPGVVPNRGGALLARNSVDAEAQETSVLLTVPRDLILSLERVHEHAKVDKDFREVLESLGVFAKRSQLISSQTARGAILSFLLMQCSIACPDLADRVSVHSPFTDYVKSLPLEDLPTFWSSSELQLLVGTTLAPAVSSKLKSLRREYDGLCSAAGNSRWYQIVHDVIDFDDWKRVDAMYRSRALDFPQIGHCMVPCVDLANHAAGEATVAIYEKDEEGNAVLLLRENKHVTEGAEITITYGDEKGACEMLFSYGFLDEDMETAGTLFLSLAVPDSDILQSAKMEIADCAPGFKLIDMGDGEFDWTGDYIWLLCADEDDGLRFEIARTVDGTGEEMHAFLQDHALTGGAAQLRALLTKSDMWDVYRLRAVAILQQRIFDQLQVLFATQDQMEGVAHGDGTEVRTATYETAMRLRRLEFEQMEQAYEWFEKEVSIPFYIRRVDWYFTLDIIIDDFAIESLSCSSSQNTECAGATSAIRDGKAPHGPTSTNGQQKNRLAESPVVQKYLMQVNTVSLPKEEGEDDFS